MESKNICDVQLLPEISDVTNALVDEGGSVCKVSLQGLVDSFNNKLNAIFGGYSVLPLSYDTEDTNWTMNSISSHLAGNIVRVAFNATRSSATEIGNVINERIARVTVEHGGKINAVFNISFVNATTGGITSFVINNTSVDDTTLTFDITLCGTTIATTQVNSYMMFPVTLNIDAY